MDTPTSLVYVPELALSDHSSDYAPDADVPRPSALPPASGQRQAAGSGGAGGELDEWGRDGWDDMGLFKAFQSAREEFFGPKQRFNDPLAPFVPYAVPDDLRARAKEKGKNSWKVRLELKDAEARAQKDAERGPGEGDEWRSSLWYARIGGRPKAPEAPKAESKRSKAKAAKLKRAAAKAAAAALVSPYDLPASKKRKQPEDPNDDAAVSPESYTPASPSFSPIHTPLSPSLDAVPDLPLDPFPAIEVDHWPSAIDGDEGEAAYVEEDAAFNPYTTAEGAEVELDPAQWDDADLVHAWDAGQVALGAATGGTGKSWLTLALEAQERGVSFEEHVQSLRVEEAAVMTTRTVEGAAASTQASGVDKVAEQHLKRFALATGAGAAGASGMPTLGAGDDVPELSYE